MPSGRTHDAVTFLLAAPAFAVTYAVTYEIAASVTVAGAFVFGGLMFGPDLDTVSRQYSRWYFLKVLWFPYRSFFKHRSRFSHGLVFGALIRVVYFLGILSLIVFVAAYLAATYSGGSLPGMEQIANVWRPAGAATRLWLGENFPLLIFIGLWFGAASHTFTDMAGSFIKTGRIGKFV